MGEGTYEKSAACYQFDAEVSAYLEDEPRPAVPAHAQNCQFCAATLADLELIRSASRQLRLEEPPAILWTRIRARLVSEGILSEPTGILSRWFERIGLLPSAAPVAALASLAVLAAILVIPATNFQPVRLNNPSTLSSTASDSPVKPAIESDEETRLARTVGDVESNYKAHESALEPTVKATYQKSLESLNTSIRECHASIQKEPSNALAREYLLSAYAQKAQVLAAALEFDAHQSE